MNLSTLLPPRGGVQATDQVKEALKRPEARTKSRALRALDHQMGHIYAGTVPPEEKARRRAKNKVARRSRKINRGR